MTPPFLPVPAIPKDGTLETWLAVAHSQVGFREGPNNANPYGNLWDIPPGYTRPPYPNSAYCGQGVSWSYETAGVPGDWRGADSARYTPNVWNKAAANGTLLTAPDSGVIGARALFGWDDGGDWIDHIGAVISIIGWRNGRHWYRLIEWNAGSPEGCWITERPHGWQGIKGFVPVRFNAPAKPDPTPVVATITALQAMKAQEDTMPLLIDLTDESGKVVGHRAYLPGLGWREPSTAELTEDNGWTRASLPAAEMEAWALQSLGDVATMTDLTARRVKAIMDEA